MKRNIKLYNIAKIIRSKNSGPFQITLDVLFDNPKIYYQIKSGGVITKERIAGVYHIDAERIQEIAFFDAALGFKVTYDRVVSSGTVGDRDVYGAQQHVPLGEMIVEIDEGEDNLC